MASAVLTNSTWFMERRREWQVEKVVLIGWDRVQGIGGNGVLQIPDDGPQRVATLRSLSTMKTRAEESVQVHRGVRHPLQPWTETHRKQERERSVGGGRQCLPNVSDTESESS